MSGTRLVKTPGNPNVSALGSANWLSAAEAGLAKYLKTCAIAWGKGEEE